MGKAQRQSKPAVRHEVSGVERLGMRVSSMINHPIAQAQRWVTIHRLDTDGDREWEEVIGVLAETDDLEMAFDDEGAVTIKWQPQLEEDRPVELADFEPDVEPAPF